MGGINSGNWIRLDRKLRVEEIPSVDIRYLKKKDFLRVGMSGYLSWTLGGKPIHHLNFEVHEFGLGLKTNRTEYIEFSETKCNYGGKRKWLICPSCGRRIVAVFGYSNFKCRHCLELTYSSRNENALVRMFEQKRHLTNKISDQHFSFSYIPTKPKGMHIKTYAQYCFEYRQLERQIHTLIMRRYN